MPLVQRMILLIASLCFLAFVLHLVKKKRLSTKYSLLWIVLSCAGIAAAAFPGWVFWLTVFSDSIYRSTCFSSDAYSS